MCGLNLKRRGAENWALCGLLYWFYESHSEHPRRILRVYGWHEYSTYCGSRVTVVYFNFWRTFYRAVGMVFPALKRLWDRGEALLWPELPASEEDKGGM